LSERIEKPWAVYGWFMGSWGIGKIVNRGHTLDIQYCEGQHYPPECWDPKWVKRFDNPVKAMAYFKVHVHDSYYTKEKIIESFLRNFPSEETNLEEFLAQRQAKCTAQLSVPNLYDCYRAVNPQKAAEIDEEIRDIFQEETSDLAEDIVNEEPDWRNELPKC